MTQYRTIFVIVTLLALLAAASHYITSYGDSEYQRGRTELALEVAKTTQLADQVQHSTEQKQQGTINALASQLVAAQTGLNRAVADARVSGNGLRIDLRTAADRGAVCTPGDAPAAGRADGPAAALGDISVACSSLAEDLAGEAERLANYVRGLQAYATTVSTP
jgi:hypothetical protein